MRTRCPACGATLSLDALVAHDGAREALATTFKLSGPLGSAVVRYLALFRPESRALSIGLTMFSGISRPSPSRQ